MSEGICARVALAGLAGLVVLAGGCSQSPAPVTRKSDGGGATPAVQQAPGATAASTASPAPPLTTIPHSSEAEPKSSAAVTPVSAPPLVSATSPAAPGGAAAGPLAAAQTAPATPAVGGSSLAGGAALPPAADAPAPVPVRAAPASAAPGLVIPIDAPAGRKSDPSVVVVDAADPDPDSKLSLVDAAKAERERKAEAPPPRIVINNKNLHAYAKGGQLTIAEPRKKGSAAASPASPAAANGTAAASAPAAPGTVAPLERDEKYWRGRALEIRQRWRKAADRIKELEGDVNLWRRRFYAEDDPYVRDGQIKPSWDRALDDLRENHEAVAAAKKELDDFLEEGRRAGALPGWLREGNELEPKEEKPVDPLQPTATPIYKEPGR